MGIDNRGILSARLPTIHTYGGKSHGGSELYQRTVSGKPYVSGLEEVRRKTHGKRLSLAQIEKETE